MKRITSSFVVALAIAVAGCEKTPEPVQETATTAAASVAEAPEPEPAPEPQVDLEPARKAAALANQITKAPDDAEKILAAEGLTKEKFMDQLYAIAEDPDLSEEYARLYQPSVPG